LIQFLEHIQYSYNKGFNVLFLPPVSYMSHFQLIIFLLIMGCIFLLHWSYLWLDVKYFELCHMVPLSPHKWNWATEQQQQGPVIQSVVWTSSSDVTWVCWPQMSNLRSHPRPYYKIVLTRCSSDLFCMLKFKKQFRKLLGCCFARKSGILAISPKTNICFTNVSFTYFCFFSFYAKA